MKKNLALVAMILAAAANSAFAGGTSDPIPGGAQLLGDGNYALPSDASNVKVAATSIEQIATGENNCQWDGDNNVCDTVYTPMLQVKITYDSKDQTDDDTALDNSNDPQEQVVGGPTLYINLPISADEIKAIQAKQLNGADLVTLTVTQQNVSYDDQEYGNDCRFDDNGVENPDCIVHTTVTESRPVLSIITK